MRTPKETVTLELTIQQAVAVRDALDLNLRLRLGQIEEVWSAFEDRTDIQLDSDTYRKRRELVEDLCYKLKDALGFPVEFGRHGSYGVGSPKLSKQDNRMYEIYKVVDHAIWWLGSSDNDPHAACRVSSDTPYILNYSGDKKIPATVRKNGKIKKLHKST